MTIHAFAAPAAKAALAPFDYEPERLAADDVEIVISHVGICHSDIHLLDNDWGGGRYPLVPGHEIVGTVVAAGDRSALRVGQRVGVGWQRSACLACELCATGYENLCATQTATCVGAYGGFADRIRTDGRFTFALPDALDGATTAPLLCAGVTVVAPIRRYGVGKGAQVGVIGIGGLGHLAVRFLRALGCEITVFSSTPEKRDEAQRLGAHQAASSVDARDLRKHTGRFHFLLSTAPARLDWTSYVQTLRPNGVLCLVGAPPGLLQIPAGPLLLGQRTICGSDIGSRREIDDTLAFAAEHGIGAEVETMPLAEVNGAIERVRRNEVRYRAVLVS
jgi:uncharacterized zinc-type alcohol dehydrogenase-like protein